MDLERCLHNANKHVTLIQIQKPKSKSKTYIKRRYAAICLFRATILSVDMDKNVLEKNEATPSHSEHRNSEISRPCKFFFPLEVFRNLRFLFASSLQRVEHYG